MAGERVSKNCPLSASNAIWRPYPTREPLSACSPPSGARYAPLELNSQDGPGHSSQASGRNDGTCNLGYRTCIIIYGKSYIANGDGDLLPKSATWTRNSLLGMCDAPDRTKTRTFSVHGTSHMQYQSCNIGHARSETPSRPFKIGNPISHIMLQTCVMPHQLSFMANATCRISYP